MSSLLEGSEQLERELTPEPVMAPAAGAVALHLGLGAAIVLYGILGGFFHHNLWGNPGAGGAIQVNLVSSALPLPSDQPPNQNVLATETPSQAPAPPEPKAKQAVDENAIPILGKQKKPQHEDNAQNAAAPAGARCKTTAPHYGEQAGSSMPRATQRRVLTNGPTTVNERRLRQPFRLVRGRHQLARWAPTGTRPMVDPQHAARARGLHLLQDLPRRLGGRCADGPLQRQPDAGQLVRARGAARGHLRHAAVGISRKLRCMISYYCEY